MTNGRSCPTIAWARVQRPCRNWFTERPQKTPSFGTCGFESHRPHMRPIEDREWVRRLPLAGHNRSEIERITGISRATQRYWDLPNVARPHRVTCPDCGHAPHD